MGETSAIWAERVAEWKASGLTSKAYCEGKPFTAGGLRHWAHRITIRVARVAREPVARVSSVERERAPAVLVTTAAVAETLVVEMGGARVVVRPGVDRGTLATVLEVLAAGRGSR